MFYLCLCYEELLLTQLELELAVVDSGLKVVFVLLLLLLLLGLCYFALDLPLTFLQLLVPADFHFKFLPDFPLFNSDNIVKFMIKLVYEPLHLVLLLLCQFFIPKYLFQIQRQLIPIFKLVILVFIKFESH